MVAQFEREGTTTPDRPRDELDKFQQEFRRQQRSNAQGMYHGSAGEGYTDGMEAEELMMKMNLTKNNHPENGRSLLSRLKCKNTSDERRDSYERPSKPSSKPVHKMQTPWLKVDKQVGVVAAVWNGGPSPSMNGVGPSVQQHGNATGAVQAQQQFQQFPPSSSNSIPPGSNVEVAVGCKSGRNERLMTHQLPSSETKKQKNGIGSVLFGRRRRKSAKSLPEYDEASLHRIYQAQVVPNNNSREYVSVEVQRTSEGTKNNNVRNNERDGNEDQHATMTQVNNRDNFSSIPIDSDPLPRTYQGESMAMRDQRTHDVKSHAPNNLAGKPNLEHDTLMGLEMHRQLNQISRPFECGAMGGKNPLSLAPNDIPINNGANSIQESRQDEAHSMMASSTISTKSSMANTDTNVHYNNEIPANIFQSQRMMSNQQGRNQERAQVCPEREIVTPRRRNSRSPSPSRFRRQQNYNDPPETPLGRNTPAPSHLATRPNLDHDMLMGLEMHRQLDQISSSFDCGMMGGKSPRSMAPKPQPKVPQEENKGFSIFSASSISCLNPSSQLDALKPIENNNQGINYVGATNARNTRVARTQKMGKPELDPNTFCGNTSSALLLDVKDDDPLWRYIDNEKSAQHPLRKTPNGNRTPNMKAPVDRGYNSETIGFHRGYPSNQFAERARATHSEYPRTSRMNRDDAHRSSMVERIPVYDEGVNENRNFRQACGRQGIPGTESDDQSKSQYESLMDYPKQQTRWDHESVNSNKELLLDQMRYAVKKASAELDSKFDERYHVVMTMETESSEDDTFMHPDYSKRAWMPRHNLSPMKQVGFSNQPILSPIRKKDKYDTY